MKSELSQEMGPRSRSLRIGFCLLAMAVSAASISCGHSKPIPPTETPLVIPPDLPVLELPAIDVGKTVPPAKEQRSPSALGSSIPSGPFVVKIKIHRDTQLGPLPKGGVFFTLHHRYSSGKMATAGGCNMKATSQDSDNSAVFQGVCRSQLHNADSVVEVQFLGNTCFVRSARVQ